MLLKVLLVQLTLCLPLIAAGPGAYAQCGDFNGNGVVDLSDVTAATSFLYLNGPPSPDFDIADCDNHQLYSVNDMLILIRHLFVGGPPPQCPPALPPLNPVLTNTTFFNVTPAVIFSGETSTTVQLFFENDIPLDLYSFTFVVEIDGSPAPFGSIVDVRWGPRHAELSTAIERIVIDSTRGAVMLIAAGYNELLTGEYGVLAEIDISLPAETFDRDVRLSWTTFGPQQGGQDVHYPYAYRSATDEVILPTILYDQPCGNFDLDPAGQLNLNDIVAAIDYFWVSGVPPISFELADCDGYELYTLSDFVLLNKHLYLGGEPPQCPPSLPPINPAPVTQTYLDIDPSEVVAHTPREDTINIYFATHVPIELFVFPLLIEVGGQPLPPGSIKEIIWGARIREMEPAVIKQARIDDLNSAILLAGSGETKLAANDNDLLARVVLDLPASVSPQLVRVQWTSFGPQQAGQDVMYPMAISLDDGITLVPDIRYDLCCHGKTGDVNGDGIRDLEDLLLMGDKIFLNPPHPWCDALPNCDGDTLCVADLGDILWFANAVFLEGPALKGCMLECE